MKLIVLTLGLLGVATSGRLDSKYLPANQGGGTGGYGGAEAPFSGSNAAGSQGGQYSGSNSGQYSGSNNGQYSGSNNGQYSGAQGGQHSGAQILRLENNNNGDGTYNYAYETSDGTSAQEQGTGGVQADGGFSYTSPEGENIQITYVANENGFQPQGAHLPTPPPIPEEILKSIEFNKEEAARGVNQEGAYHEQQYNNNQGGYGGGNGANNANGPQAQYGAPAAQQPFAFGGPAKPFGGPAKPFAPKPQYGAPNQGSSNGGYRY